MSRSNTGLWNGSYGEIGATLKSLEDRGVTLDDLKAIRTNNELAVRVVAVIKAHTVIAQSADMPRRLRSPDYYAGQVNTLFSLNYTEEQIMAIGPPPDALPGFLTFFDPGWDILRLRQFCANKGKIFYRQGWYGDENFSKRVETPCYRQIRLEAVDGSFNKDFDSQQCLLAENEEVPSARVVVMGMAIHFLLSGHRLFEKCHVRCADKDSDGGRVYVGGFGRGGLRVDAYWDDHRHSGIGLASSRKF